MRRITVVPGLVLALLVAFGVVGVALAAVPTDTSALRNAVRVESIMDHENAFQNIADANGGTRVSGTSGYDASAAYVKEKLEAAGYKVTNRDSPTRSSKSSRRLPSLAPTGRPSRTSMAQAMAQTITRPATSIS